MEHADLQSTKERIMNLIFEEGEKTLDSHQYRLNLTQIFDLYQIKYSAPLEISKYGYSKLIIFLKSMPDIVITDNKID